MTSPNITTTTHTARQGDTLELLCWRVYGERMIGTDVAERALALNHGIAANTVLATGQAVLLPVLPSTTQKKEVVQLWN